MGKHEECRFCDGAIPVQHPDEDPGFMVCRTCGAEWDPVLVEDEPISEDEYDGRRCSICDWFLSKSEYITCSDCDDKEYEDYISREEY